MKVAATVLLCLLASPLAQAIPTVRIFASGFGDGEPPNDCSPASIAEPVLEAKFLRRTTPAIACIPPNKNGIPQYCNGSGCSGNPGCQVPLSPPAMAVAMLPADFVAVEETVSSLAIPFTFGGADCVMLIDFSAPAILRHEFTLQTTGLDALTLTSADGIVVSMPAFTWGVIPQPTVCIQINPGTGFAGSLVAEAADAILVFETANAPADAAGSTVCPVTQ